LYLAAWYPGSVATASGSPSTWSVTSATIRSVTASPQAPIDAGPTVRGAGDVISPWAEADAAKPVITRRMLSDCIMLGEQVT
jgi:hypothetical protein